MSSGQCWLVKSEPYVYSIEDLERDGSTMWDGVRNYEARNIMRDRMKVGDPVLFYHSAVQPPGVAGVARVSSEPYPDPTALDPDSDYHDPKSDPDEPRWYLVDVEFVEKFPRLVTLAEIRERPELAEMTLLKRSRLSVQPVRQEEFDRVRAMAREDQDR